MNQIRVIFQYGCPQGGRVMKAARPSAVPRLRVLDDWSAFLIVLNGHWSCWNVGALSYAMRGFLQGYAAKPRCGVGRSLSSALCKQRMNESTV